MGCPSHCHPGNKQEVDVFHAFPTPDALAAVIDTKKGQEAESRIQHTRHTFATYLPLQRLTKYIDKVFFVGDVGNYEGSIAKLIHRLGGTGRNSI